MQKPLEQVLDNTKPKECPECNNSLIITVNNDDIVWYKYKHNGKWVKESNDGYYSTSLYCENCCYEEQLETEQLI